MKALRYAAALLAAALLLPTLSGCKSGSLYNNYREVENLQLIRTLGVDRTEEADIRLSASSGADIDGQSPTIMAVESGSISQAMEKLQNYVSAGSLFFAHADYLILGEAAARAGIASYLDYVDRIPQMRTDVSLFLIREGEASTLITGAGDGQYDVTDELLALEERVERLGGNHIYSCADVSRRLAESGAALVMALSPAETEGVIYSGGGGLSSLPAGYGVLKDGALIGYILGDAAKGVSLLEGRLSDQAVSVSGGDGSLITLSVTRGGAQLKPVWDTDGSLAALEVNVEIDAAIQELGNPMLSQQSDFLEQTAAALAARAGAWVENVLAFSAREQADFLALGQRIRRQDPVEFAQMPQTWEEALADLDFQITVTASIQHGYETSSPINVYGDGKGGTA